ncbi:Hedgling [Oopsacas minuta]|uniref:Hedgling n=1 Tax=Oopsacas minuta TaxID=111878 RepID=A0AAV7K7E4_9METZ|nr:Hedgling [Oopsacas minuta]
MKVSLIFILILSALLRQALSQVPPTFTATEYIFTVSEDASVDTALTATSPAAGIGATDVNGDVITFRKSSVTDAPQILIDPITGNLTVRSVLDRETTPSYSFDIIADDGMTDSNFLPSVIVQIILLDVNDNAPVFVNRISSYSIEEGVSNGYQVNPSGQPIMVTDADIGNNQPSTFSIEAGADGRFAIDSDGNIRTTLDPSVGVEKILDFETTPSYQLTIRATNIQPGPSGIVFTETQVTVLIIDINDEDPIFLSSSTDQSIILSENFTGVVFTVQAEDTDHPLIATTFTYSIIFGNDQIGGLDSFTIDPTTGVISVAVTMLDHEEHPDYALVISAQEDQTPKASVVTTLFISITNENEFPPTFSQLTYTADISEVTQIGRAVLLVQATDDDTAHSIIFALDGSTDSESFDISASTGLLSSRLEFDREIKDQFTFKVLAIDEADGLHSPLTSTAQINVTITDVNDNSPEFNETRQTIVLNENMTLGVVYDTSIANRVEDDDDGINKQVKYSLQTLVNDFTLDPDTGELQLVNSLDFNTISEYTITIIATDQAVIESERRTGSFVLTIEVNDINNNSPVLASIGAQTINEDLPVGSIVFSISALDKDIGLTTPLSLSIMQGANVAFILTITGSPTPTLITAQISTNETLEFASSPYTLTIEVTDGTNTDSEVVNVTVLDVNNNAPIFSKSEYEFFANENELGTFVGEFIQYFRLFTKS